MVHIFQVLTTGALYQVDAGALRTAASAWHDEFAPLAKPLLVVTIGGPTSNYFTLYAVSYSFVLVYCICCFVYILIGCLVEVLVIWIIFGCNISLPDTLVFLNLLLTILSPELGREGSFRISSNLLEHVYAGYLVCLLEFIMLCLQESRTYFSFMQHKSCFTLNSLLYYLYLSRLLNPKNYFSSCHRGLF